jgi:MFS family permease
MAKKKLVEYLILAVILVIAVRVRLYKIENPIADWHSWRQADTSSVSRYFFQHGINLLYPKYDDRSSLASGKPNPQGYRMVEFPLYNALHALFARTGWWNFEETGRILSVIFSVAAIFCLWGVVRLLSGPFVAITSALIMASLPFGIYYSRVVLPDPLMTFLWLLGTWVFLAGWFKQPRNWQMIFLSSVIWSVGMVVRPYLVFFSLPIIFFVFQEYKLKVLKKPAFWLYLAVLVTPFILWRLWIRQFPEGIPASGFLYNYSHLRFGPAWFRWLFGERLAWLILGGWGLIPLMLGLVGKSTKKENWFYQLWFFGVLLYFSVFAGGNVMHDYYQAITIPVLSVLIAKGIEFAFAPKRDFIWPVLPILTTFSVLMMLGLTWYQVREYYNINNWSIVHAGQRANEILPQNVLVVAPYQGDTAFLYQINRPGYPIIEGDIKNMVDYQKVNYYVSVNYDAATRKIMGEGEYKIIEQTPEYVIVKLRDPK